MSDEAYQAFLASKAPPPVQFGRDPDPIPEVFFEFQAPILKWAIRRGRAALFLSTGLGKTLLQAEWLRQSGKRGLIIAPLGVTEQTIEEARSKLGMEIRKATEPSGLDGYEITNFERLHRFVGAPYDALVVDEASRLKSIDGKQRTQLIEEFTHIPRRLVATATPAPNEIVELANYAEFLGIMSAVETKATFFVHDTERSAAGGWRLKGHAQDVFWRWLARWAIYLRKPSDLGFEDGDFTLPPLEIREAVVKADWKPEGMLFATGLGGIGDRREVRRATIDARVAKAVEEIVSAPGQWIVWCGLNDEGDALEKALGDQCVQISGSDDDDAKVQKEQLWRAGGGPRVLITKTAIYGAGLNWQHCQQMMFLGLGDSWEQYFQGIRRCWRFGQKHPVGVVVVRSDVEQAVADNLRRKEADAERIADGVVKHAQAAMLEELGRAEAERVDYEPTQPMVVPSWLGERAA